MQKKTINMKIDMAQFLWVVIEEYLPISLSDFTIHTAISSPNKKKNSPTFFNQAEFQKKKGTNSIYNENLRVI